MRIASCRAVVRFFFHVPFFEYVAEGLWRDPHGTRGPLRAGRFSEPDRERGGGGIFYSSGGIMEKKKCKLKTVVLNQNNEIVVDGYAIVKLPE